MGLFDITKLLFRTVFPKKEKPEIQNKTSFMDHQDVLWDVLELTEIGLWEWNIENERVVGSDSFFSILGLRDRHLNVYEAIEKLVHPEYQAYVNREIQKAVVSNQLNNLKLKIIRPDGQERWIVLKGIVRQSEDTHKAYGILMDITESQKNELRLTENLDFFQALLDGIPFPIFFKDEQCVYKQCNQAFSDYLKTPKENIIDHTVFDISPGSLAHVYQDKDAELIKNGGVQHYQSQVMQHTGELKDVEFYKSVIEYGHDYKSGIVGIIHDITKWKQAEQELQKISKLKDSMLEISQIVLGLNDLHNVFEIVIDKAMETIESADIGCVLMRHPDGILRVLSSRGYEEDKVPEFQLKLEETYAWAHVKGAFKEAFIINDIQKYGHGKFPDPLETETHRKLESSLSTPILLDGELIALINVDSYENESFTKHDLQLMNYLKAQIELTLSNLKLYQETVNLSRYDTLTGAYNRSYFDDMLEHFMTKADRYHESFEVVIFDLDQLKKINENYGHHSGDELLKSFVRKLKENLRESDFLARYGGDEFVAVFFESTEEEIRKKLEGLNEAFSNNCFCYNNQCFGCSFSYGIAQYPADGSDYPSLFSKLDKAISACKRLRQQETQPPLEDDDGNKN